MFVTIIVPLRNEEAYIERCLESVLAQEYPRELLEVLLVDGMSSDKTRTIIEKYQRDYAFIFLLDNPGYIVPTAMNIGIRKAKGELIVRLDAHAEYESDYVSKCVEWSQKTGVENVGGPMVAVGEGYWGKAIEMAHHSWFGLGGGKFHDKKFTGIVDTVYLGAFRRQVFDRVGLYNERLVRNQDIELNARIRANGGKCCLTPEIRSRYYCRNSLKSLWQQNYNNGKWAVFTSRLTRNAMSLRHFVPLIFVLANLAGVMLLAVGIAQGNAWWGGPLFLSMGTYFAVNIFISACLAGQQGMKYFPALVVVFGVLHCSYGIGSIAGLFQVRKWMEQQYG